MKAEKVFNIALKLMDEVRKDGSINVSDTMAYKAKTPDILTVLQTELLPNTETPVIITSLDDDLLLTDRVCLLVLPYGLAAHLMLTEDKVMASFFNDRYEELKRKTLTMIKPITDVYGVNVGMM